MTDTNPEVGLSIDCVGPDGGVITTNYHDVGTGDPVLLLHGSGPGVSAWANWRLTIRDLSPSFRLIAPDLAGFGFTQVPEGMHYSRQAWLDQIVAFLDALGLSRVHVIGNSFGGSMALALAIAHPERVNRLILMGSVGVKFDITEGLDAVWGYEPSVDNMRVIMDYFAYDRSLVGPELVDMRYRASARPGVHEAYSSMFPAPRQRWVDAMSHDESAIRGITAPTLLIHGRDDQVIPLATSLTMLQWISDSQLHIFGRCGHWTQIEHAAEFARLVEGFLA